MIHQQLQGNFNNNGHISATTNSVETRVGFHWRRYSWFLLLGFVAAADPRLHNDNGDDAASSSLRSDLFRIFSPSSSANVSDVSENIVGGISIPLSSTMGLQPFYGISKSGPLCGATLVHVDIAVTAAHCAGAFLAAKSLVLGGVQLNGEDAAEVVTVLSEHVHPKFNSETLKNDIMLLHLRRSGTAGSSSSNNGAARPISGVNIRGSIPTLGTSVTTIGFGSTVENGAVSSTLQYVNILVHNGTRMCSRVYNNKNRKIHYRDATMICASDTNKDACHGDSGGPLLQKLSGTNNNWLLVGLVSWGVG